MASIKAIVTRERALLAGDGVLLTAAIFGPVLGGTALLAAFVALVVWLVADSWRDLRREPREHARLDVVRLVAVIAFVIFVIGVVLWVTSHPDDSESGDAAAFAIAAGIVGGLAVSGAEVATTLAARKPAGR